MTSITIELDRNQRDFIGGYLEAIDFAETGGDGRLAVMSEFDDDSMLRVHIDCLEFLAEIDCYLYGIKGEGNPEVYIQAGNDFWFTRNNHGVGYWDRPEIYGEHLAQFFTKKAEGRGERNVVAKDNGGMSYT